MPSRPFVTAAAVAHFVAAAALLFRPELLGLGSAAARVAAALYAAALLGLGFAAWVARAAPLGGIYGRAVVTGHFAHGLAGALALVRPALAAASAARWGVLAVYAGLALGWGWLLLRGGAAPRAA